MWESVLSRRAVGGIATCRTAPGASGACRKGPIAVSLFTLGTRVDRCARCSGSHGEPASLSSIGDGDFVSPGSDCLTPEPLWAPAFDHRLACLPEVLGLQAAELLFQGQPETLLGALVPRR